MATKTPVIKFTVVEGKKPSAEASRALKDLLAKAQIKADAFLEAKRKHFENDTESAMYEAQAAYCEAMVQVATCAGEKVGALISFTDPIEGHDVEVGLGGSGMDTYDWRSSSICW